MLIVAGTNFDIVQRVVGKVWFGVGHLFLIWAIFDLGHWFLIWAIFGLWFEDDWLYFTCDVDLVRVCVCWSSTLLKCVCWCVVWNCWANTVFGLAWMCARVIEVECVRDSSCYLLVVVWWLFGTKGCCVVWFELWSVIGFVPTQCVGVW